MTDRVEEPIDENPRPRFPSSSCRGHGRLASPLVSPPAALAIPTSRSRSTSRAESVTPSDGKLKEATIQFSNALKVDHDFADAHYELAKVYLKQGSTMPGYAELCRTVDLAPNNQQARIELGNLLLAGNAADKAVEQANAVLALNPQQRRCVRSSLRSIAVRKGDRADRA